MELACNNTVQDEPILPDVPIATRTEDTGTRVLIMGLVFLFLMLPFIGLVVTRRSGKRAQRARDPPIRVAFHCDSSKDFPLRASPGAAGRDLRSSIDCTIPPGTIRKIPTKTRMRVYDYRGLATVFARLESRSGLAVDRGLVTIPGIIDSDYHGYITVLLHNTNPDKTVTISKEDRISQIVLYTTIEPECVQYRTDSLPSLNTYSVYHRGERGFGSTGIA